MVYTEEFEGSKLQIQTLNTITYSLVRSVHRLQEYNDQKCKPKTTVSTHNTLSNNFGERLGSMLTGVKEYNAQ